MFSACVWFTAGLFCRPSVNCSNNNAFWHHCLSHQWVFGSFSFLATSTTRQNLEYPLCAQCHRALTLDPGDPYFNSRARQERCHLCRLCRIVRDLRQALSQLLHCSRLQTQLFNWFEAAADWLLQINSYVHEVESALHDNRTSGDAADRRFQVRCTEGGDAGGGGTSSSHH